MLQSRINLVCVCVCFAEGCVGSGLELMGNASSLRLPIEAILGAGRGGCCLWSKTLISPT